MAIVASIIYHVINEIHMNKKIIFTLVGVFMLFGLVFLGFKLFYKKESSTKLMVSGHPAWPPIMYQQNDQISGAGAEIIDKILTELKIETEYKYMGSWDVVQEKVKDGSVDILVAAYKTKERQTYMDYSIPYTIDPVVLVVKKGKEFVYDHWDDLIGKKGVVTKGDSYGQDFDNYVNEKLNPLKVETPTKAFELIKNDKVDYFVYALYSAEDYIYKNNLSDQVEIISKYISTEDFYLTISKKSTFNYLLPKINILLEKYKQDGTIDQIINKYKKSLWNADI